MLAEKANEALLRGQQQSCYRPIYFEKYKKPQVVEYPRHAMVLNPQHAQLQQQHQKHANGDGENLVDPLMKNRSGAGNSGGGDHDDDDPIFMDKSTFICSDDCLRQVMKLSWREVGPVGQGLDNLGNTCFANAILQAITYTPALAQYFAENFRSADNQIGAPHDFAYALGETIRQLHLANGGRNKGSYRPVLVMNYLRNLSSHFQLGRQCDAHEFAVQLLFAAQKSILFRHVRNTKIPHRVSATTALLRICGGYLLSQVTWSKRDEIEQLQKKGKRQEAADLQLQQSAPQGGDVMYSNTYDPMTILSVELAGQTLEHCLQKFCEKEKLDGRCYHSPRDVGVRAEKQFFIHIPPNVLMIQIKRFSGSGGKAGKRIRYPLELNLQPFCTPKARSSSSSLLYTLNAVCIHSGHSIHSGHYYSVVRARNGSWYECNDSMVRLISEDRALDQEAYMLFYSRRDDGNIVEKGGVSNSSPSSQSVPTRPSLMLDLYSVSKRTNPTNYDNEEEYGTVVKDEELVLATGTAQRSLKRNANDPSGGSPKQRQREEAAHLAAPTGSLNGVPPVGTTAQLYGYGVSQTSRSTGPTLPPLDSSSTRQRGLASPHDAASTSSQPLNGVESTVQLSTPSSSPPSLQTKLPAGRAPEKRSYTGRGYVANTFSHVNRGGERSAPTCGLHIVTQPTPPPTLQRQQNNPKFQQRIRDPTWQMSMDQGKQKKVKSKGTASDETFNSNVNRFQEASQRKLYRR